MECLGPRCAAMLLDWLKAQRDSPEVTSASAPLTSGRQGLLWSSVAYRDDAATIGSDAELAGAIEHLDYAVFRRFQNQLTRAERRGWTTRSAMRCSRSGVSWSGSIRPNGRGPRPASSRSAPPSATAGSRPSACGIRPAGPT